MKYDLTITCMFSFSKEKYAKAFDNFKEYGLLNIRDRNIKLNALIAKKDLEEFCKHKFPYEVETFVFDNDNIAEKIYGFYRNNINYIFSSARWHIQVDDDSSTDIDGLITKLDKIYDPEIPLHMICGQLNDLNDSIKNILLEYNFPIQQSLNVNKFYSHEWAHEWEFSVQSFAFFKRIYQFQEYKNILNLLSNSDINSDHGLSLLAILNKIPVITCRFAHFANIVENFSLNGGEYYHIHYLNDKNYKNIMNLNFILNHVVGKDLIFYGFDTHAGYANYCHNFKLNKDNTVTSCHENERFWKVDENSLCLLDENKNITSFFQTNPTIFNNIKTLVGQFNLYSNRNSAYIKIL